MSEKFHGNEVGFAPHSLISELLQVEVRRGCKRVHKLEGWKTRIKITAESSADLRATKMGDITNLEL